MGDEDYPSSPASPRITPEEARLLWEVVESHCGLSYSFGTASYLERRALPRLRALGLGSFREYFLHLRYGESREQELGILIEQLTNHETYFFRERYQLEAFRLEVLPQLVTLRRQYRLLNVWSAGCSTGEEAYTVAMLLSETYMLTASGVLKRAAPFSLSQAMLVTASPIATTVSGLVASAEPSVIFVAIWRVRCTSARSMGARPTLSSSSLLKRHSEKCIIMIGGGYFTFCDF